jgi:hypothetical protein
MYCDIFLQNNTLSMHWPLKIPSYLMKFLKTFIEALISKIPEKDGGIRDINYLILLYI